MSLSVDWAADHEMALGKILRKLLVWPIPAPTPDGASPLSAPGASSRVGPLHSHLVQPTAISSPPRQLLLLITYGSCLSHGIVCKSSLRVGSDCKPSENRGGAFYSELPGQLSKLETQPSVLPRKSRREVRGPRRVSDRCSKMGRVN